jgi:mRNA-degrading endonuclease RelE of RelBE toxin-antitoxin system
MAKKLKFSKSFKDCYIKLPDSIQKKLDKQLWLLQTDAAHPSLNLHRIKGTSGIWEGYVDKFYRFTFEITEEYYYLRLVGPHNIIDMEDRRKKL